MRGRQKENSSEREREPGEGTKGEGGRESQGDSTLSKEPDAGLYLTTPRSRPQLKSRVGCSAEPCGRSMDITVF